MEQLRTVEATLPVVPEVIPPAVGRTALELLARPVEDYRTPDDVVQGYRPLQSTPTQQRTWDQANNHPDTQPDINQE